MEVPGAAEGDDRVQREGQGRGGGAVVVKLNVAVVQPDGVGGVRDVEAQLSLERPVVGEEEVAVAGLAPGRPVAPLGHAVRGGVPAARSAEPRDAGQPRDETLDEGVGDEAVGRAPGLVNEKGGAGRGQLLKRLVVQVLAVPAQEEVQRRPGELGRDTQKFWEKRFKMLP